MRSKEISAIVSFITMSAFIRPKKDIYSKSRLLLLVDVSPFMIDQIALAGEVHSAIFALIRLASIVYPFMDGQVTSLCEYLCAALKWAHKCFGTIAQMCCLIVVS